MSLDTLREELDWVCRPMVSLPSVFLEDFCDCLDKLTVMLEEEAPAPAPPPRNPSLAAGEEGADEPLGAGPEAELEPEAEAEGEGWSDKLNDFSKWIEDLSKHFPKAAEPLQSLLVKIQKSRAEPNVIFRPIRNWAEKTMYPSIKKRTGYLSKQWEVITSFKSRLKDILQ